MEEKQTSETITDPDFNLLDHGVGGIEKEVNKIFRKALVSRFIPAETLEKLGVSHVRGILLYGPPGTGKTLIARKLSQILKSREPKIVNCPELVKNSVEGTNQKLKDIFADAIADQENLKEKSPLHIIIFDEFEALCKKRGSEPNTLSDSFVDTFLSLIDGVNNLGNILVIGMTNSIDLIDPAVLRRGRLEIHVEIKLPSEAGRIEIFNIHTKKLKENGSLAEDVNIENLAKETKNFTGAEIEAVVRCAASFAISRNEDKEKTLGNIKVELQDFLKAISEITPSFSENS